MNATATCRECGSQFTPPTAHNLYCAPCTAIVRRRQKTAQGARYRAKYPERQRGYTKASYDRTIRGNPERLAVRAARMKAKRDRERRERAERAAAAPLDEVKPW